MTAKYRLYKDYSDYIKIREFLQESISVSGPTFYYGLGDFDFCVALNSYPNYLDNTNEIFKDVHLWFEDEKLVGGIWPSENRVDMFINQHNKNLFNDMVSVGEEFVKSSIAKETKDVEIEWWIFDGDLELENVLRGMGYYKTDFYRTHRIFDFSTQITPGELPDGYIIRNFSEAHDKAVLTELYKKYFYINLKENGLKNLTKTPTYREELDLVVEGPDGTAACFCTIRYDDKNKIGTFEPVACHPDHKRRGLSKAIMLEGLKRAKDLGADIVTVQTSDPNRNFPANELYESVGFRKIGDLYFWRKKIL